MSLRVNKITRQEDLNSAFTIRKQVFVVEQDVDPTLENDEFEASSNHFLAKLNDIPVGTARWRYTANGIKLERFAVLENARGKGLGKLLVQAILADINATPAANGQIKYLHSQLPAVSLYSRFGFEKEGDVFEECNILHYKMKLI